MDFQGPHSTLRRLLDSGEHSDLTLTCQGEEFKLHKAVVCLQSPVIATALRGNFKEARINVLSADAFDLATVKRMIDFMYTGDYQVGSTSIASHIVGDLPFINDEASFFPGQPDSDTNELHSRVRRQPVAKEPDALLCHVRVNAIADYYDVPELNRLTTSRIQHILKNNWSAPSFLDVVGDVLSSNGNMALHDLIASTTADHIEDLVEVDSFSKLELTSTFAIKVLRNCATKLRARDLDSAVAAQEVKSQHGSFTKGRGPNRTFV